MSTFEYVFVFISIVIGLGVVHVLTGLVRMFEDAASRPYWVHLGWCFMVLYTLASFWWFQLDWRTHTPWEQPFFLFLVAFAMLTYVLSAIVVPLRASPDLDYRTYFYASRVRFFGVWALWSVVNVSDALLKGAERTPIGFGLEFWLTHLLFIVGFGAAAATSNERFHQMWVALNVLWIPMDVLRVSDVFGA